MGRRVAAQADDEQEEDNDEADVCAQRDEHVDKAEERHPEREEAGAGIVPGSHQARRQRLALGSEGAPGVEARHKGRRDREVEGTEGAEDDARKRVPQVPLEQAADELE